jgi:hypothetical protein
MVVLIDFDQVPQPSTASLQKIFGLTPAEARLAVLIAKGETLAEIADRSDVSMATARKHLACVFQQNPHAPPGRTRGLAGSRVDPAVISKKCRRLIYLDDASLFRLR